MTIRHCHYLLLHSISSILCSIHNSVAIQNCKRLLLIIRFVSSSKSLYQQKRVCVFAPSVSLCMCTYQKWQRTYKFTLALSSIVIYFAVAILLLFILLVFVLLTYLSQFVHNFFFLGSVSEREYTLVHARCDYHYNLHLLSRARYYSQPAKTFSFRFLSFQSCLFHFCLVYMNFVQNTHTHKHNHALALKHYHCHLVDNRKHRA